jgi:hemerythrin-like domain-containing protein
MKAPIAGWRAEHENFARLLDLFEREIAVFHNEERPNYELLLDILRYMAHFPDRYHHPREDVAFARLVRHDPSLATTVARLQQEHRVIAAAGAKLIDLLEGVLAENFAERSQIERECAMYLVYYRHHINAEERGVMPFAEKLLTEEDWKAVSAAVASGRDPLFGSHVDEGYLDLRGRIDIEAAT